MRALKGILLLLLLALLELRPKTSILGSVQTTGMVSLNFSEILKCIHRKTEEEESTKEISF